MTIMPGHDDGIAAHIWADLSFPRHKAGLSLTHDDHLASYMTVEEWEQELKNRGNKDPLEWVNEEQRAKAIANNSYWHLHWYPDTPVSFYRMSACDLDVLLAAACEVES